MSISLPCPGFLTFNLVSLSLEISVLSLEIVVFSSHFYFTVFVFLSVLMFPMLLPAVVINLSLCFSLCSRCVDAFTQSSMMAIPFLVSFLAHIVCLSSLGFKALCIVNNFLIIWSICLFFACTFKENSKYLTKWISQLFIPFIISYLPTPPLGQDMTQGQFLSGV